MVLKKSRLAANTDGTQRRSLFIERPHARKNGLIIKKFGSVGLSHQISTPLPYVCVDSVSLKKTKSAGSKQRTKNKESKAKTKSEIATPEIKQSGQLGIVWVEKGGFQQMHHENGCKALPLYDPGNLNRPIQKSNSCKCKMKSLLKYDNNIDVMYEVDYQLALLVNGWDNGDKSKCRKKTVYSCKETRGRKEDFIDVIQLEDDFDILSCSSGEESYILDGTEEYVRKRENATLGDFVIEARGSAKTEAVSGIGNCAGNHDVPYSKNHASSQTVITFPKKNVIAEIPEMHKLLDEYHCSEHSSAKAATQTTRALIEEKKESEHSEDNSAVVVSFNVTEVSIEKRVLEQKFGKAYVEGGAYPRCFAIFLGQIKTPLHTKENIVVVVEVTNDMTTSIKLGRGSGVPVQLKVFNARSASVMLLLEETNSANMFDFHDIVNRLMNFCHLTSAKNHVLKISDGNNTQAPEVIEKLKKWKTRSVTISEAFDLVFDNVVHEHPKSIITATHPAASVKLEEGICPVCYIELVPNGALNSGPNEGAALSTCCHWLCRNCWKQYLDLKINDGSIKIECPFTDCNHTVDIVSCLSFSSHLNATKYLQLKFEYEVQHNYALEWCPGCENAAVCDRFGKENKELVLKDTPFVHCSCKKKWCFSCKGRPHWPASCEIYSEYHEIHNIKDLEIHVDENGRPFQTTIDFVHCPFCKTPINKTEGCNSMICRCGGRFCFNCGKPSKEHDYRCDTKIQTRVFSSWENFSQKAMSERMLRNAVKYQQRMKYVSKLKTRLNFEGREAYNECPTCKTKLSLLRKAFQLQEESCSIAECVDLMMVELKSEHANRLVTKFLNKMDSLWKYFEMTMNVESLEEISNSKLLVLIRATEEQMLRLKDVYS